MLVGAALVGCAPAGATNEPGPAPNRVNEQVSQAELTPGERLLYLPEPAPEELLGREVLSDERGYMVFAPERRPGCIVTPRPQANAYAQQYTRALNDVVGIRAELPRIADLEAQYSGTLSLSLDIVNASLIRADLEGDCGEKVVTAIRVGTGSREVTVRKQGGAKARVDLGALGNVETGGGRDRGEAESLAWAQPQGWSIEIGEGNRGMDDIRISMPEQVTANVPFGVEVDVGRAFWLVVLYRDANGDHDVILPRGQYKAYHAEGERVALPDMTSTNLEGETSTLETLVVYGFADEADFRRFVPPQGKITAAQANTYASELQEALDNRAIPPARWSRAEFTFEILAGQ